MKFEFWLISLCTPLYGISAETILTLVKEPVPGKLGKSYGVMDVVISGPGVTPSRNTTELTGTVEAELNINHQTASTAELTLSNGNIRASNFSLSGRVFLFASYNASARNLAATLSTPAPPGLVNVSNGQFDASQHQFIVNQGDVVGSAAGESFNQSFSPTNPFQGLGSGTGTVTLTPRSRDDIYQNYEIEVIIPNISISNAFTAGTFVSFTASVTGSGDIKAKGNLRVPLSEYLAWTVKQGAPGVAGNQNTNRDGIPNALAWAMNLPLDAELRDDFQTITADHGFQFVIPELGSLGEIKIQHTTSLGNWEDVPAERVSLLRNPLPIGSSGVIRVYPSGYPTEFFRLVTEY